MYIELKNPNLLILLKECSYNKYIIYINNIYLFIELTKIH